MVEYSHSVLFSHRALAARTLLLARLPVSDCELVHTLLLKDEVGRSVGSVVQHARRLAAHQHSEAVIFNLVQPLAARRQFIGFGWKTRGDEAGWKSTLQHNADS